MLAPAHGKAADYKGRCLKGDCLCDTRYHVQLMKTAAAPSASSAPSALSALSPNDYLIKALQARVYDVAIESDLQIAPKLSERIGHTVLLKREDQQPVFSFKLRGAYNKMAQLTEAQKKKGVICASAGNHAQGVALGAKRMGLKSVIVMPTTTPQLKVDAVKRLGGEVVLAGESYSDAYGHAKKLEAQKGMVFIHPFDDPAVIAGQGTVALEILKQVQAINANQLDAVFVAIGGGGLIAGVASVIKSLRPEVKVIGVQAADSHAMMDSVQEGHRVELADVGLFSDGTAVKLVGEETFRIVSTQGLVDGFITVSTDEMCAAIKDVFDDTRVVVEPAGALAVAAIKKYAATHKRKNESYASIVCGANMNFDRLRFVAERAEVGEEREALFAVTMPEERGSFKRFCELIGELPGGPRNITEFNYRMGGQASQGQGQAHVFVGITTPKKGESSAIVKQFVKNGFASLDLTHDDLARDHIRHMVGGVSLGAADERLLSFTFPERPGALMKFLAAMRPGWNISLFHYRNQGADYGKILVGLQVPAKDDKAYASFLQKLGYPYTDESANPAYRLFLR